MTRTSNVQVGAEESSFEAKDQALEAALSVVDREDSSFTAEERDELRSLLGELELIERREDAEVTRLLRTREFDKSGFALI